MIGIKSSGLAILAFVISQSAFSSQLRSCDLDWVIKKNQMTYMPAVTDYRWFKAQFWQESRFRADAISPAGARGVAQIMPGTEADIKRRLNISHRTALDPHTGVEMGMFYNRQMWNIWKAPRTPQSRLFLTFASYNAGAGNVIKAQKVAGGAAEYHDIILGLPAVTGNHSKETIDYVEKIQKWKTQLGEYEPCLY